MFGMLQEGMTPLIWACNEGHLDIVNVLIDKGANIDDKNYVRSNLLSLILLSHTW